MSTRTTEVRVTREVMTSAVSTSDESSSAPSSDHHHHGGNGQGGPEKDGENTKATIKRGYKPYSVTIDASGRGAGSRGDRDSDEEGGYMKSIVNVREGGVSDDAEAGGYMKSIVNVREGQLGMSTPNRSGFISGRRSDGDDVAWSYTRAALSYFLAMVITWVSLVPLFTNPILFFTNHIPHHLKVTEWSSIRFQEEALNGIPPSLPIPFPRISPTPAAARTNKHVYITKTTTTTDI